MTRGESGRPRTAWRPPASRRRCLPLPQIAEAQTAEQKERGNDDHEPKINPGFPYKLPVEYAAAPKTTIIATKITRLSTAALSCSQGARRRGIYNCHSRSPLFISASSGSVRCATCPFLGMCDLDVPACRILEDGRQHYRGLIWINLSRRRATAY